MAEIPLTRRQLLGGGGAAGLAASLCGVPLLAAEGFPKDGAEALALLQAGNARFAEGQTQHAHSSADWRKHLAGEQKPVRVAETSD